MVSVAPGGQVYLFRPSIPPVSSPKFLGVPGNPSKYGSLPQCPKRELPRVLGTEDRDGMDLYYANVQTMSERDLQRLQNLRSRLRGWRGSWGPWRIWGLLRLFPEAPDVFRALKRPCGVSNGGVGSSIQSPRSLWVVYFGVRQSIWGI